MGRPEETVEPSMDEILASIRKIISEDPSDVRKSPDPRGPAGLPPSGDPPTGAAPGRPGAAPHSLSAIPFGAPFSAADRLPMSAQSPHPVPPNPGSARPDVSALEDDLSDILEGPPRTPVLPPASSASAPPPEPGRSGWRFSRDAVPSPPPPVETRADSRGGGRPIGSLSDSMELLRNSRRPAPANGSATPSEEAPQASSDADLAKPESSPLNPARKGAGGLASPRDLAAGPDKSHSIDTAKAAPATEPLSKSPGGRDDDGTPRIEPAPMATPIHASAETPVRSPLTAAPFAEPPAAVILPSDSDPLPIEAEQAAAAARSALGVLAAGLAGAAMPSTSAPDIPGVAPEDIPEEAILSKTAFARPAASDQPGPARTLEDTVAEMLRPMLREWLDTNMPRIVEKAIRVEIANKAPTKNGR